VRVFRSAALALLAAAPLLASGAARAHAQVAHAQDSSHAAAAPAVAPRLTVTLDAGAASVTYDEFLRSSVYTLAPAGRLDFARGSITARGAASRFQSGNQSWQGALAGAWLVPLASAFSLELGALGTSTYYDGTPEEALGGDRAGSLLGQLRVHATGRVAGAWAGATRGLATDGFEREAFWQLEAAGWRRIGDLTLTAALRPAHIGDATFTDGEVTGHWWWRTRLELSATGGVRGGDTGGGARAWGELATSWWLGPRVAIVAGGGRFPTDLLNGVPGARYATLALRLATRPPPRLEEASRPSRAARPGSAPLALLRSLPAGDMVVRTTADGQVLVRLRAPEAATMEIMGDFTEWEPVSMSRAPDGMWERRFPLAPGTYRFNVRRDGGAWEVPTGVPALPDDLGGEAGLLVVG
jgi:hypothetical protein